MANKKINIRIEISFSKVMSLLVLIMGSIITFYLKDANVFITTIAVVSAMIVGKQFTDIRKPSSRASYSREENDNNQSNQIA